MALEGESQDALNGSGVLPFRQGDLMTVRERILSLRVPKPVASELEMHCVAETNNENMASLVDEEG